MTDSTTASRLGAYRRELEAEGFTPEAADSLVRRAASRMLNEEPLIVSDESAPREGSLDCCYKRVNHRHHDA